jgi:CheY-like chemotaxis protein
MAYSSPSCGPLVIWQPGCRCLSICRPGIPFRDVNASVGYLFPIMDGPSPAKVSKFTDPLRVLVVDDYPDAAESLAVVLRFMHHTVVACRNAAEALDKARAFRPHIALVDLALPGMDGFALARHFRADENLDKVMLIAVTGFTGEEFRLRSLEAGFAFHLLKPVDMDCLSAILTGMNSNRESHAT